MEPKIAKKGPYEVNLKEGDKVYWCACGRSSNQPFCDGSHKGTEFTPVEFSVPSDGKYFFCGCKRTGNKPLCDGTHNKL